jgi:hypothetical protein
MERNLKEVFREAAQLPERDRATLAGLLIETLDPVSDRRKDCGIDSVGRRTLGVIRPAE